MYSKEMHAEDKTYYDTILKSLAVESGLDESFESLVAKSSGFAPGEFLDLVDNSDYSIVDWAMALRLFDQWLSSSKLSDRNFNDMTGYIHCCEIMISNLPRKASLQDALQQALTEYGFDPAKRLQE